jgi:RND family efflux transporter MFP subunit
VRWFILAVVIAGAAFAVWSWIGRDRPIPVQVASITVRPAGTQAAVLNASGYVTARRRATVSAKITGKVIAVDVEEGMTVHEGQVLARLDDVEPRASLALAEAQVDAAKRALRENEVRLAEANITSRRATELLAVGVGTQAELDAARANVDSIAARISALEQQVVVAERQAVLARTAVDNTIVRAPFSGVAISKDAQPGEMVSPISAGGGFTRTGICTIVDMRSLEIEVDVNESYINRIRPNQRVTALLDAYPDWQIPARVITTIPAADRQKATVLVRIGFLELREEEPSPSAPAPVTLAPRTAIKSDGSGSFAFVVQDDVVERRAVQTGGTDGDRIEIRAGLGPGDRVVVSPPDTLAAGSRITVQ